MSSTHQAFVYVKPFADLDLRQVPTPVPGLLQVLLKVEASGVCHSDLHILKGVLGLEEGKVLGHEVVGTIAALGTGVDPAKYIVASADLYAVHITNPCGDCMTCKTGNDNVCPTSSGYGLGLPGGYQQFMLVSVRDLIKVPSGISAAVAAVTTDAVLTPYHAIKKANVNGLSRVLIIGLGGLGINAVQIAKKALGARVTCYDIRESARKLAQTHGADVILEELTPDTPVLGEFDVVLDIVGAQDTFDIACKQVKVNGIVIPLGLAGRTLTFDPLCISMKQIQIQGSFAGTSLGQAEVFNLISRGVISPEVETADFKNLNSVLKRLKNGLINSRMVLTNF